MATTFSPSSFYALAHLLSLQSKGDDAQLRTSISRAYYSAFIEARDAKGLSSRGATGHKEVISRYKNGDAREQSIADHLKSLKWLREVADYEPTTPCKTVYGTDAISHSAKVLKALGIAPPTMLGQGAGVPATVSTPSGANP